MILGTERLVGVDTNVVARYLLRDDEAQYQRAKRFFDSLTPESPGLISIVTLAELFWVLTRSVRLSRESALTAIRGLLENEMLEFDDGEGAAWALHAAEEGADFADALIEATMMQFGATETVTFDSRAADRLGWRLL